MTVVLSFDGKQLPEEMKSLPSGRYVLQSVDDIVGMSDEQEAGLEAAALSLDRGEGLSAEELRGEVRGTDRR
jgi:hypothetical protein